jgi:hypothetical protein
MSCEGDFAFCRPLLAVLVFRDVCIVLVRDSLS